MAKSVYAIATLDTKAQEIEFVANCLRKAGVAVKILDVSASLESPDADIPRSRILGSRSVEPSSDRGVAVTAISEALTDFLICEQAQGNVSGVLGIGGSSGTALITRAMRALPIGFPKLMLSTVASGNTAPYVDCSDITMMFSVVDIAGLNAVSERILANAAHAMAGMVSSPPTEAISKPTLGMTMFGVTTPCVTAVREELESKGFDCLVFHAVGSGGRAMENLVRSQLIQGVLDITTTEVADEIVGGIFPAGPHRFEATVESHIPHVLSVGAVDMVNFGARDTVPDQFRGRCFHEHNAQVTLMRTTADENVAMAKWMANKLNQSKAPLTILLPEGGVSALDAPGQVFYDPEANEALFSTLEKELTQGTEATRRNIFRLPRHINDPQFSRSLVEAFEQLR